MPQLDERARIELTSQIQRLTLPAELGEAIKVIALGRGLEQPMVGFRSRDSELPPLAVAEQTSTTNARNTNVTTINAMGERVAPWIPCAFEARGSNLPCR